MPSSKVLLADGSDGVLCQVEKYCSLVRVNNNIWALRFCGGYIDVLDPLDGGLLDTIDLPEVCVLIRYAANRVWMLALSGHIIVCETSGAVFGVLDALVGQVDNIFTLDAHPLFLATSKRDSFQLWDVKRMTVQREFPCEGNPIVMVFPISKETSLLLSVHEHQVALWSPDVSSPICIKSVESTVVAAVLTQSYLVSTHQDTCWLGGGRWISIFRVVEGPMKVAYLEKERLIPCANVQQLHSISTTRIASLDAEALVTVWDSRSCTPLRLFKVDTVMGMGRGYAGQLIFLVGTRRLSSVWTLYENTCLIWTDHELEEETETTKALDDSAYNVMQDRMTHLLKTNTCLVEMMEVYRKKVLEIVMNPSSDKESLAAAAVALDRCLGDQLVALGQDGDYSSSKPVVSSVTDHSKYWREKCVLERERNALLLHDLRHAIDRLNERSSGLGLESKVAELLNANCASHERESELCRYVLQLEACVHKLGETDTLSIFTPRESAEGSAKNNKNDVSSSSSNKYKHDIEQESNRIAELRRELQCVVEMAEGAVTAQKDVKEVTMILSSRENALRMEHEKVLSLTQCLSLTESENEKLLETVDYLQDQLRRSRSEKDKLAELLKLQQDKAEDAAKRAAQVISEKMEEIRLLQQQAEGALDSTRFITEVALRDTEIEGLKRQLGYMKTTLTVRQEASLRMGNMCDSVIEELQSLKRGSPMALLVHLLEDIDSRLKCLNSSEKAMMEKDDQLAARDDELRILQGRIQMLEVDVMRVSPLFSEFPYNAEDLERLLIELNEYRQRYGRSEDIDEVVAMNLLQVRATRYRNQHEKGVL